MPGSTSWREEYTANLKLMENEIEADKQKQQEFFDLADLFRSATDPDEVKRLGDQMGRMVFGN